MTGQGGEALELALGLLRAPALRSALRRRPLPGGIGEVLAIASESSEATRAASARTGRPASDLVEASRFYIQQVLLADEADAYRSLGASPEADHAVLRDHHRLLLRWLHPDRSGEGAQWDSALSTRVNQAWNLLRTPGARARYDAERSAAGVPAVEPGPVPDGAVAAGIPRPVAYRKLDAPEPIPTGPIAVAFLTLACLALAWLAWTREGRLDELRDASRFQPPRVDVSERMAAPLPHVLPEVDVHAPAPAPLVRVPAAIGTPPEPLAAMDVATPGFDASEHAAGTATFGAAPVEVAALDATPVGAATAVINPATEIGTGTETDPATGTGTRTPAPGEARESPALASQISASRVPAHQAPVDQAPANGAPANRASASHVRGQAAVVAATPATHLATNRRSDQNQIAATLAPRATRPTQPASTKPATDPLQLFHEAEAAIGNVATWFAAASGHEPPWLDPQAASGGNNAREGLRARQDVDSRTRMAVDQPNWTLGSGTASMSGAYRLQGRGGTLETGVLHVRLARRGDHWRVASLQLEPAQ